MLRQKITDSLKGAMKSKDERATSTYRLMLAALKDRDIAARGRGKTDGIDEAEILQMLQTMVKQRQESIELYKKGNRPDLVKQEEEEIAIIRPLLPQQLDDAGTERAVDEAIAQAGAKGIKDMGRAMAALKEKYAGRVDFAKAGGLMKKKLG